MYKKLKKAITKSTLEKRTIGSWTSPKHKYTVYTNNTNFMVLIEANGMIHLQIKTGFDNCETFARFAERGNWQIDNINLVAQMFDACNIKVNISDFGLLS
jgi:hypothetical protein